MKDYSSIAATALRLVTKFGRPKSQITMRRHSRTPAGLPQDGPADSAATNISVAAVFVKPPALGIGEAKINLTEDQIKQVNEVAIVAGTATTTDLRDFDQVLDGTDIYQILWVVDLMPGTTQLLYMFGLKQ